MLSSMIKCESGYGSWRLMFNTSCLHNWPGCVRQNGDVQMNDCKWKPLYRLQLLIMCSIPRSYICRNGHLPAGDGVIRFYPFPWSVDSFTLRLSRHGITLNFDIPIIYNEYIIFAVFVPYWTECQYTVLCVMCYVLCVMCCVLCVMCYV